MGSSLVRFLSASPAKACCSHIFCDSALPTVDPSRVEWPLPVGCSDYVEETETTDTKWQAGHMGSINAWDKERATKWKCLQCKAPRALSIIMTSLGKFPCISEVIHQS